MYFCYLNPPPPNLKSQGATPLSPCRGPFINTLINTFKNVNTFIANALELFVLIIRSHFLNMNY